jgi:hypothetical protein
MGFETIVNLESDTPPIQLGGRDKKTGKANVKSIEGYYLGFKSTETKFGPGKLHIFQTPDGNTGVWGKTNMDSQLAKVIPGCLTRVTFIGTVPSKKGNDMWKYKVEVDKSNSIEVSANDQPTGNQEPETEDYAAETDGPAYEDTDLDEDDLQSDEATPARAAAPRQPATTPSASRQKAVQDLLRGRKTA